MNKKAILLTLFMLLSVNLIKAQISDSIRIEKKFKYLKDSCKNYISFACSVDGSPSENIYGFLELIISERYDLIEKILYSDNPANQFLSVIVLEFLEKKRKLTLKSSVKERIAKLYQSHEIISVCRGCTYHDKLTLKELLNTENYIKSDAVIFCKRALKI